MAAQARWQVYPKSRHSAIDTILDSLETVDLDLFFSRQTRFFEELGDVVSLVALQLYHLPVLWVVHHRTIASKLLLCDFDNLFEVKLGGDALDCGECFAAVPLLDPDVDQTVASTSKLAFILSEWVARLKVCDISVVHANDLWVPPNKKITKLFGSMRRLIRFHLKTLF